MSKRRQRQRLRRCGHPRGPGFCLPCYRISQTQAQGGELRAVACRGCGASLLVEPGGTPRTYCGDLCRRSHEARTEAA